MARALADVEARTISQLGLAKWRSSGLEDTHARKLGLRALSAKQVQRLNGRFHRAGALFIPYHDLDGRRIQFYRIRYLEKLPGAAGIVEKPQRYDQLPVRQEAYYPCVFDWRVIANDVNTALCITEGELKADCACVNGIPCVALGGVYSFMSGKRGIDLLPSLKEFKWEGRCVYVVYDNDLYENIDVARAQRLMAQELLRRGAKVSFAHLPPGPAKGLDDFIVAYGAPAFNDLLESSQPYLEGDALWGLNEDVALIRNEGVPIVVERQSSIAMSPDTFVRALYANRHYMAQIEKGSGKNKHVVLEERALAPRWLEWENRSELNRLVYEPGAPKQHGDNWNTWNGWGVRPQRGDMGPWRWLMDFLFMKDDRTRKYFEQWCAYPIQHPGAKLYTAVLIWSRVKRLGKSMAAIALSKVYGDNAVMIDSRQLKGAFNSWAKDRQLVIGEEITAGEARVDADWLKGVTTSPSITINSKFKAEYTIRNCINFLFLSNHPDALFLEDGDQRYLIHEVLQNSPAARRYYEIADKWLHGPGPSHLMYYLQNLDLCGFNPREHAPDTLGKQSMIRMSKSEVGLWVLQLQEDPTTALRPIGGKIAAECDLFTPEMLYRAYDPEGRGRGRASIASLGRALASAGFRQVNAGIPVQTSTGLHRLYAVKNAQEWEKADRDMIREHFDLYHGPQRAGGVK